MQKKTRSAACGKIKRLKLHRGSGPIMRRYRLSSPSKKAPPASLPNSLRVVLDQRDPNGLAMFCGAREVAGSPCARSTSANSSEALTSGGRDGPPARGPAIDPNSPRPVQSKGNPMAKQAAQQTKEFDPEVVQEILAKIDGYGG
ncbi:hypothetical protein LMTR13_27205 [Bradyrhizobium icense]|uniref:Uncharacterized protein n=1 Tax=Bradyrhizobium icense TaxID=1274631 RepID=A0A1B1UKR7_9BRAD|nr:hypothetical protein LMTR13_27205 [Bradyrhizobium icense]